MTTSTGVSGHVRSNWVDVGKAISIILVVTHHALSYNSRTDLIPYGMMQLNNAFLSFRMPFFFFISGLFTMSAIQGSFVHLINKRIINLLYLFILWCFIRATYIETINYFVLDRGFHIGTYIINPIEPPSTLWFLYALIIYTTIAWVIRNISFKIILPIVLAAFIFVGRDVTPDSLPFPIKLISLFPWFYIGLTFSKTIRDLASRLPLWSAFCVPVYFCLAFYAWQDEHVSASMYMILSLFALPVGCILAIMFNNTSVRKNLENIGRNTLPIYVAHILVVWPFLAWRAQSPAAVGLKITIVIVLGIWIPLAFRNLADRLGASALFEIPPQLKTWCVSRVETMLGDRDRGDKYRSSQSD